MKEDLGSFMELARVQSEINRLFDNLLDMRSPGGGAVSSKWVPNADVLESRDEMVIRFELPGVDPGGIKLAVAAGNLILSGEKPDPLPGGAAHVIAAERGRGEFRRVIHIGVSINPHQARVCLKDGLLTLVFPKVTNRRGEEVQIPVSEESADGD
jgi:HSP20 family protein